MLGVLNSSAHKTYHFMFIFNIFIQFLHFLLIVKMQTFVHKCRFHLKSFKRYFFRKFQITFHKILKTFRLTLFSVDRCFTIDVRACSDS